MGQIREFFLKLVSFYLAQIHILQRQIIFRKYFKGKRAEANVRPAESEVIRFKSGQTNKKSKEYNSFRNSRKTEEEVVF